MLKVYPENVVIRTNCISSKKECDIEFTALVLSVAYMLLMKQESYEGI